MRFTVLAKALVIAFVVCTVIGEEAEVNKEHNTFDADVAKILNILINSLYTNQEVFLREVISNASDALDKIRMMYLTEEQHPKNDAGEEPKFEIKISIDKDKRMIYMVDGGVGMTKDEMKNNLGSLGSSGTQRFLEGMKEGQDSNLIGQFGVGFYSVFLVSERVKVASKSDASDKQYIWESTGDGSYFLYEDPRGNTLGRGTELMLELKKDADQFLDNEKLKTIVHRYSEFIHFPIYIKTTKTERVEKEKSEDEVVEKKDESEDGEVKDDGDDDGSDEKKEDDDDNYENVPVDSWDLVNDNKPIWTRKAGDVNETEYEEFYKALTKDYDAPMFYTHFSAEGEVEFKAILFVPGRAPYNVFDTSITHSNIRLYVRRVFITDEFKDLLPRYLNFVKGVVDSDDLPLHVSREQLQESRILKIIKKKLIRKALTMFSDIAASDKRVEEEEAKKKDDDEKKEEESDDDAPTGKVLKEVTFPKFWEEFGKNLRLGLIEDGTNRARLTKLLRFKTSKNEDKFVSLEDYVERMAETQKNIYYLTGESIEKIKQVPVLYDAEKREVEVIFMTDAIDEYVTGHVTDFSGKKLVNLAKQGISEDESKTQKNIVKGRAEKYEGLTKWFKELLGDKVTKATITQRMTEEPLLVASPKHGATAQMMKLMKSQTLGEKQSETDAKRVLEINHLHPLIHEIWQRVQVLEEGKRDENAEDLALVLFDVASLQNGFEVDDSLSMGKRIGRMLRQSVDISPDAPLKEEDVSEYDVADEEEEDEGVEGEEGAEAEGEATAEEKKEEL
jgi:HSP90 family molecular chaperone